MRRCDFSDQLKKVLAKLYKKDRNRYEILMKKVEEIAASDNIDHYKNLRAPLSKFKRVHIDSHFVLTFREDKQENTILFYDFDHHDNIYRKGA